MPNLVNWDQDESVFDDIDFLTWKYILHVQSRVGKGESLPLTSKGCGVEWRWTPHAISYGVQMRIQIFGSQINVNKITKAISTAACIIDQSNSFTS